MKDLGLGLSLMLWAACLNGAGQSQTISHPASPGADYLAPKHISVLPVFLVPLDEHPPTLDQQSRLQKHLAWAQRRYAELLPHGQTFEIAAQPPVVVMGQYRGPDYDKMPELAGPQFISEVLGALGLTRFNAPYSFFIVVMNTRNELPAGGGRTLNGGFNTGPGMVEISSWALDKSTNFQSTVQHELGHSFGLPHVDAYGYDMQTNASVMSYNPHHHTHGFAPSATPGILIPEDIRGLALNHRAFPHLIFDPHLDQPAGYHMARLVYMDAQTIPGQLPYAIQATTTSGETYGSSIGNMLGGVIKPSAATSALTTFDPATMWQSDQSPTGWVTVDLSFPMTVGLSRLAIYSQHSGRYHMAQAARLSAKLNGNMRLVCSRALTQPDSMLEFPVVEAKDWRLELQAGATGMVVLRGLRFFHNEDEIFPRPVPTP